MSIDDAAIQNESTVTEELPSARAVPSTDVDGLEVTAGVVQGILLQLASGFAVYLPFIRLHQRALTGGTPAQAWLGLTAACLLVGLGAGFALQPRIRVRWGPTAAVRFAVVCVMFSVAFCLLWAHQLSPVLAGVLAGLGLFGEWTASAELTRRSLTSTRLWTGMRIHAAMFFCGGAIAAVTAVLQLTDGGRAFWLLLPFVLLCVVILNRVSVLKDMVMEDATGTSFRVASTSPVIDPAGQKPGTSDLTSDEDCDAEECCGGGCAWRPMPAWQGVCFATIGMYAIAGLLLPEIFAAQGGGLILRATGAIAGIVVFQAVVPATGYAVLLLSSSLCGCILFGLSSTFAVTESMVTSTLVSVLAPCLFCGCSGVIGESFVEGRVRKGRSAILMLGSLAAAACTVLLLVVLPTLWPGLLHWVHAAGCLILIALIRLIPSPMLSQRRQDEMTQSEASEILAADPEILQDSIE